MMNNKIIATAVLIVVAVILAGLYIATEHESNDDGILYNTSGQTVVDAVGRTVPLPDTLDHGIVTIGSAGPLRFISCFDACKKVIEVDEGDIKDSKNGRAYSYSYPFDELTRYHADNALESRTAESIGNLGPSLIVVQESVWNDYNNNCNILAKRCALIVIKTQNAFNFSDENRGLSADIKNTFNILGKALGEEERAAEVIIGIESIISDLRSLTGTSNDNVYVAGVTIQGSNTLNTTFPIYVPLDLVKGNNAYKGENIGGKVTLNIENFTQMNIQKVVIDPSSSDKIKEQSSQLVLEYLYKLNANSNTNDRIRLYITVPTIWDSINYDSSLASAYYLAYLLYGTISQDQLTEKINNVFTTFYGDRGENVFADMTAFFEQKSAANGVEMPLLKEVFITENNGVYSLAAA
ncbi:MAG: ABC transporter substrate-binding protein [Candidatus Methanoplasma sp.]|nr:ABC transporter substrate-binding protein [Candidatus Methanoplasma sp.]